MVGIPGKPGQLYGFVKGKQKISGGLLVYMKACSHKDLAQASLTIGNIVTYFSYAFWPAS